MPIYTPSGQKQDSAFDFLIFLYRIYYCISLIYGEFPKILHGVRKMITTERTTESGAKRCLVFRAPYPPYRLTENQSSYVMARLSRCLSRLPRRNFQAKPNPSKSAFPVLTRHIFRPLQSLSERSLYLEPVKRAVLLLSCPSFFTPLAPMPVLHRGPVRTGSVPCSSRCCNSCISRNPNIPER